jgi:predicted transcriptional regulator
MQYHDDMTLKITSEQRAALQQDGGPVRIEDEQTHRVYFLVDQSTFANLQRQEDLAAIREGIADMEAGCVAPLDEVMARIRTTLGLTHS